MKNNNFFIIYLITALLSIVGVTLITLDVINDHRNEFKSNVSQILKSQEQIFKNNLADTYKSLEQIASIYAGNKKVQELFMKGRDAVEREGGGAGGIEADRIRDELYDLVGENWNCLTDEYDVRQLQFHLAPGDTSFLRVHRPEKFGDNMDDVRHMIVHTNNTLQKAQGFEIGRVISGLRGVVPVFAPGKHHNKQYHIGAVEVGMSFLPVMKVLNQTHIAHGHSHRLFSMVLLEESILREKVWPELIAELHKQNRFIDGHYIESTVTPDEARNVFLIPDIDKFLENPGVHIFTDLTVPKAFISIPLHDFETLHQKQPSKGVGHVVIWLNISTGMLDMQEAINKTIVISLLSVLVILTFAFFVLRYLSTYLQGVVNLNKALRKKNIEVASQKKALAVSEFRFRHIVETSTDWIWEVDCDGVYTYASPSIKDILGYKPEEMIGKSMFESMPSKEMERVRKQFRGSGPKKLPVNDLENVNLHKNGQEIILLTSAIPIFSEEGEFTGYRGIDRDITVWKSADKLRQEKKAAELANKAKSDFLANISHELRTPMHGILSYAHFGVKRIDKVHNEKIVEYFHEIEDSGKRLMFLLNDLLDLAKLESGRMQYNMEDQDISWTIRLIMDEFAAVVQEKGLHIAAVFDDEPLLSMFDADRIAQVLRNLVSNAIKFSSSGSTILIKAEIKTAVINKSEQQVVQVAVVDNGVGIPKKELDSVFDKFVQSSKTKTGAGGTGLGLAICKQIVSHHKDAHLWAEQNPDGGTIFILQLLKT